MSPPAGGRGLKHPHHSYELVPTAGELEGWIETVDAFAGRCEALRALHRPL